MDEDTLAERIAQAIEADRVKVTAPAGTEARAWQLGHNKGLSDAATIARAIGGDRGSALAEDGNAFTHEQVDAWRKM